MTAPGSFEIGKGHVTVRARVEDASGREAGQAVTEQVQDQVDHDAPAIGDRLADGVSKGAEDGVKRRRTRIKAIGDGIGDDVKTAIEDNLRDGEPVFASLSRGLDDIRAKAKSLRADFARTGSTSVFGDLKKAETDAKRLETIISDAFGTVVPAAERAGTLAMKDLTGAVQDGGPEVQAAITAALAEAGTLAAPALASAVGGAILSGASLAVLGGGLYEVFQDPAAARWTEGLKGQVASSLSTAAVKGLEGGFISAEPAIENRIKTQIEPLLTKAFTAVEPEVAPLLDSAVNFVQEFLPPFTDALRRAQPVVATFARYLPTFGEALGKAFDIISHGAAGGSEGVAALITGVNLLILTVAELLNVGEHVFHDFNAVVFGTFAAIADGADAAFGWIPSLGGKLDDAAKHADAMRDGLAKLSDTSTILGDNIDLTTGDINEQTEALKSWSRQFQDANDAAQQLELASLDAKDAIASMTEQVKLNGRSLKDNTEKGRDNIRAIIDKINKGKELAAQVYNETGSTQKATAAYNDYIKQLVDAATKAGYNKDQVQALVDAYGKLPKSLTITIKTHYETYGTPPPIGGGYGRGSGGGHSAERSGGVRRAASGLASGFFPEGMGPLTVFDEPGTGGEARVVGPAGVGYVPMTGRSDNNLGIIATLAGMYGRALTGQRPGDGATQPTQVVNEYTVNLNGPWNALDPNLPRQVVAKISDELKRYEKSVR